MSVHKPKTKSPVVLFGIVALIFLIAVISLVITPAASAAAPNTYNSTNTSVVSQSTVISTVTTTVTQTLVESTPQNNLATGVPPDQLQPGSQNPANGIENNSALGNIPPNENQVGTSPPTGNALIGIPPNETQNGTSLTNYRPNNALGAGSLGSSQLPQTGLSIFGQSPGQGPPNPVIGFLIQFWWLIPIALFISAAGGIWFERSRKKRELLKDYDEPVSSRNATVVAKVVAIPPDQLTDHEYTAKLPSGLAKKYPDAEYIAEGGVSRVFRVRDEKNKRDAAVKVPIRFDEVTGTQFTKELTVWEGLHHKNIVEIYAANIFPQPYIEMEYVASSLAEKRFPFNQKKAISVLIGVAEGLAYAHQQGIVHRDIKPGNILLTFEEVPKITDWGLSKEQGRKQSGIIGFSLEYAAPEQLAPSLYGEPGPWTDIYQLGVLFYEMLTGNVPFTGNGMGEITHAILHNELSPGIKDGKNADLINKIIARCLRKKSSERYASVKELLEDLYRLVNEE